ncbi:DUF5133 domain-containing protein [Streptomyces tsukubensis]|nr:DUF5133 domain-containing protein [Streptomyces tsukubensis]
MLHPERRAVARVLDRYRAWERLVLDHPANTTVRRRFEATAYTLCVLMAQRTSREAAHAAEHYLGVSLRRRRAIGMAPASATHSPATAPRPPASSALTHASSRRGSSPTLSWCRTVSAV